MGDAKGSADSIKEELGWLKVLFAVLAAVDAPLTAWFSQNYAKAEAVALVPAGALAIAATVSLLWLNHAAYRKIHELKRHDLGRFFHVARCDHRRGAVYPDGHLRAP